MKECSQLAMHAGKPIDLCSNAIVNKYEKSIFYSILNTSDDVTYPILEISL